MSDTTGAAGSQATEPKGLLVTTRWTEVLAAATPDAPDACEAFGRLYRDYWPALYGYVRRRVALKIIKLGMDTRAVVARFEAERQALAMMDHPHIARVFDGGAIPQQRGRPYFVMELVRGVPITEYCEARKLTTRERLELFIPVCQAVQHAHQKGIDGLAAMVLPNQTAHSARSLARLIPQDH